MRVFENDWAKAPAGREWSVLEVITHLIAGEIENYIWIDDVLNDDE